MDAVPRDALVSSGKVNGAKSYPVADALAARGVPFVFSTGYTGESLDEGYRDRPLLGKPYRDGQLVEMLTRLLQPAAA